MQKKLIANDGQADKHFGTSVTINNNDITVGAYGAAYVFLKSGNVYSFQTKLLSPVVGSSFGCSVSISNDVAVIGASAEKYGDHSSGEAHIFRRNGTTWTHFCGAHPLTSKNDMRFGSDVIIKGDYLFIGASHEDPDDYTSQGSVYVYK